MRKDVVAVAALLCAAGCGRIGFGGEPGGDDAAQPDAALGFCPGMTGPVHDEDGDGVGDPCDVCPQLADVLQEESDGDGVGDACDPAPAKPNQHLVFFDPFLTEDARWEVDDSATFEAGGSSRTSDFFNLRGRRPVFTSVLFAQ